VVLFKKIVAVSFDFAGDARYKGSNPQYEIAALKRQAVRNESHEG
jgi:hypothetical protein